MASKSKAQCTPEEWAAHLAQAAGYRDKHRERIRAQGRRYTRKPESKARAKLLKSVNHARIVANEMNWIERQWTIAFHVDDAERSARRLQAMGRGDRLFREVLTALTFRPIDPAYEDMASEVMLAVLNGDISMGEIGAACRRLRSVQRKRASYGVLSLDDPSGIENMTFADVLPADVEHF